MPSVHVQGGLLLMHGKCIASGSWACSVRVQWRHFYWATGRDDAAGIIP